jgi:alcohol dehydrogenase class IV
MITFKWENEGFPHFPILRTNGGNPMAKEFIMPGKIISGEGALQQAGPALHAMGSRALIVTGRVVKTQRCFEDLLQVLNQEQISFSIFSGITGEPTDAMILAGLEAYRQENCDFLIAIGGGSPLDAMKAIGVLAANPGKLRDFMGKEIGGRIPPMAAIPTTAGTGSEATKFTIITDCETNVKMLLKGDALIPDLAVVDPQFTITSPPSLTAATGLDALTHAIEAYTSRKAQPMTDVFALSAVKRIFQNLPTAFRDGSNASAREEMSLAALEAGVAFNNASVTLVHGMSRPIGAMFHVPHGISNAMLLKACMSFALDGAYDRFAALAEAIGVAKDGAGDEENAAEFLSAVEGICEELKIPTLEEYGIYKERFFAVMDKMATDALISGSPANTIKEVTKQDILTIYENLWK